MRTRWKVLSSILAMVMIISSFTFFVAADSELEAYGSVGTKYDYSLYSNGTLNIKCHYNEINLELLNDDVLYNAYQIIFDLSDIPSNYSHWFRVYGDDCKTGILKFETDSYVDFDTFFLYNFPCADDISFPEGTTVSYISLNNMGITSLDCINELKPQIIGVVACGDLMSAEIPSTVYSLSIDDCYFLNELDLSDIESIDHLSLTDCPNLKNADISKAAGMLILNNNGFEEITVPNNRRTTVRGASLRSATIASGREVINGGMFFNCPNLTTVSVPSSVTTIMYSSFYGCKSLKSITLPSSVKDIGSEAFAFSGLESFTIPSGVINIEYKVFANCKSLKSVTIPTSIECVDASAFVGCTSLTDVYYQGTEAQWNQIMFDPEDISVSKIFNNATIHFNSEKPTGWVKVDGSWRLFDSDGKMLTGWQKDAGKWYYLAENGEMRIGWQNSGDKWYYLDPDTGAMVTGWTQVNGKWYYLESDGAMKTGWHQSGSTWYYLNTDGDMATGWKTVSGKWYYFETSGKMATGWKSIGGKWYYFSDDGDMQTGWIEDEGDWYYLKSDGSMAYSEYCEGYWINADGTWTYQYKFKWEQDSKGWYYIDSTRWYVKDDTVTIDGKSYSFDSNGYWIE